MLTVTVLVHYAGCFAMYAICNAGQVSAFVDRPLQYHNHSTIQFNKASDGNGGIRRKKTLQQFEGNFFDENLSSGQKEVRNNEIASRRDSNVLSGYSLNSFGSSNLWSSPTKISDHSYLPQNSLNQLVFEDQKAQQSVDYRGKRGVTQLYNMISCATGCNPLHYKGYGCYCGFLGSGRALDGIDRCCQVHDSCYEDLHCPVYSVYFQPYFWKCYQGQPLCALENYSAQDKYIGGCAARLCECDRRLAMCLSRFPCPARRTLCISSPLRLFQNLFMLT